MSAAAKPITSNNRGPYAVDKGGVYGALTADLGGGARDENSDARNVLDLNGLLAARDVHRFITALLEWKTEIDRTDGRIRARDGMIGGAR